MKKIITLSLLALFLATTMSAQVNLVKRFNPVAGNVAAKKDIAKKTEPEIKSSVVDFTDIPLYDTLASSTHEIYSSLDEYTESFNIKDYIIIKGIKKKDSTQFLTIEDEKYLTDWRCETPIEVIDAYYGDVQAGDEIIFDEFCAVIDVQDKKFIVCDETTPPIKKNTEYILLLSKSTNSASDGRPMYSYIAMYHSIHELNDTVKNSGNTEQYISAINKDAELSAHGSFKRDVLKKYYFEAQKLDKRIDTQKELSKLGAESVDKLNKSDKALLEKLTNQYGKK